ALEDLDRLDVVRSYVGRAIGRCGSVEIPALARDGGVVDGNSVDDEERLAVAGERLDSANADVRRRARLARLGYDVDIGRLRRERVHDIGFVALLDDVGRHGVDDIAEFLAGGA